MDNSYNHQVIENEAQSYWDEHQCFKVSEDLTKEKFYCLSMFPYPSGHLHMGHVRNYTLGDVIARYQTMLGKNVLQPIGWDAFGLPAENAAIKHKVQPAEWTKTNIEQMRTQFKQLGLAYDWKREFATCDPSYYVWEQWFFLKLYEKGLVYKRLAAVNWDPVDQTVLANEQVVDGRGWRSGALVERREIPQWFIKITTYADELLDQIDKLSGWPEQVKTMQRNWIGRSTGATIHFDIKDSKERLKVFSTRPDTLFGATYLAIAPEHPLALSASEDNAEIAQFVEECKHQSTAEADIETQEKRGIESGFYAIHPLTGEALPIWIANFVLMEYGSGAVMAVPAHDTRDHAFAKQYHLNIKPVVLPLDGSSWDFTDAPFIDYGTCSDSGDFTGLSSEDAIEAITNALVDGKHGEKSIQYRLRDWGISRQRYWGTPIPMIFCDDCGTVPVPYEDLPVTLPTNVEFDGATSPLKADPSFYEVKCPKCGADAKRETDTFDTFVESSWYYARFCAHNQDKAMLDDRANYWTPVDQYVGGIEHAVMHLLYARLFHKLMRDLGLVNSDEPFTRLLTQGMVLNKGAKMSKSKGNTVDPQPLLEKYGADTLRVFAMFAAPPEQSLEWSDSGVEGAHRFIKKCWQISQKYTFIRELNEQYEAGTNDEIDWTSASDALLKLRCECHSILAQALLDYERSQFNTVVSACMKLANCIQTIDPSTQDIREQAFITEAFSILLRLLAPIAPHICHVLWRECGYGDLILNASKPRVDKSAIKLDIVEYVIQVNGKLRGQISVPASADETTIEQAATQDENVLRFIDGKTIQRVIVIANRNLVNLVVK